MIVSIINKVLRDRRKYMPSLAFGQKLQTGFSQFTKLKDKGDKLRFRLLDAPFVEGKHFFKLQDGSWEVVPCVRINDGQKCVHCDTYFSMIANAKKSGDKTVLEQAKQEARQFQCAVVVYYPVIDRETEEFKLFQTTLGVRGKIEAEFELGTKVLDVDFIVLNTGGVGKDRYMLTKADSADTKPLTSKELEAKSKYKTMDLSEMIMGSKDESGIAAEANVETDIDAVISA